LRALRRYQILDTPPEPAFDRIAEMAANFFHVPRAGVSLVDEDHVWFKSRVGIDFDQTARDAGLCSSAMLSQGVYYLNDAAHDERALGHSFVLDLGIRFHAAAPLRSLDGFNLGTVWVLDQKPRELAAGEAEMLRALAALATNQMELRLYAQDVARLERVQRTIAEGVEAEIGDRFFSSLARSLAQALEVRYAFVTRLSDDGTRFKILPCGSVITSGATGNFRSRERHARARSTEKSLTTLMIWCTLSQRWFGSALGVRRAIPGCLY
jgi:GAF domain-containing protein